MVSFDCFSIFSEFLTKQTKTWKNLEDYIQGLETVVCDKIVNDNL